MTKPIQQDIFGRNFTLDVTPDIEVFRKKFKAGDDVQWGGNQILADQLQQRESGGLLLMTEPEIENCFYKAWGYLDGGWQGFFRAVVRAGERAGWRATPALLERAEENREKIRLRRAQGKPDE